jgi:UDP-N-acetyl-D-glucosamine dehydrogenase
MSDGADILAKAATGTLTVAVVGLGYVGLPLALAFAEAGAEVIGIDIDPDKPIKILAGESYLTSAPSARIRAAVSRGTFITTTDHARAKDAHAVLIAVPTPLGPGRTPDMHFVEETVTALAPHLANGCLLSLESTVYPGATREIVLPLLEAAGLRPGLDVLVAYAPEREDPGNAQYNIADIPKVVAGLDAPSLAAAKVVYGLVAPILTTVSSLETAEAVKITENVFRAVNIALVNELKGIYADMDIDMFEVVDAAASKPFGYMPFYPGPGLGGHCIPIDPFYLAWRARELGRAARFVELAGDINAAQPVAVVNALAAALSLNRRKALNGATVLVLGVAYKRNVNDIRESPALEIIDLLRAAGADVAYHDPFVPEIGRTRGHPTLAGLKSVALNDLGRFDAAILVTDHDDIDYVAIGSALPIIVDTRGIYRGHPDVAAIIVRA